MQTFFATTDQSIEYLKPILPDTKLVNCDCGQSMGYIDEKNNCQIIICDACHSNCSNQEKFL